VKRALCREAYSIKLKVSTKKFIKTETSVQTYGSNMEIYL
jgi:hypothetical protein